MNNYWWLYFRSPDENVARAAFVFRFGREPERCEWDGGEGCWWLGMVSEKELKRWKRRRKQEGQQMELVEG
jgi:hypothetical protein